MTTLFLTALVLLLDSSLSVKLRGSGLTIASCEGSATAITSSTCYQNRYVSASQYDNYPQLQKLSQALYDAVSKQSQGEQYMNTIVLPQLQDTLAAALMRSVIDLALNTSDALSELTQNIGSASNQATSVSNGINDEFKKVIGPFQIELRRMLQNTANLDTANLNGLIQLANSYNLNVSAMNFASELSNITTAGYPVLTEHTTNVTDIVNRINDELAQAPSSITLDASKFATDIQTLLTTLQTSQNLKMGGLQNTTIDDITNRMNNIMTSVDALDPSVTELIDRSQTDLDDVINARSSLASAQLIPLNESVVAASEAWTTNHDSTLNSIASILQSTSDTQTTGYTSLKSNAVNMTSSLRSDLIPTVSNWDISAKARIEKLNQELADGSNYLLKALAGNVSADLWEKINMQLSQAAAQQASISQALSKAALDQEAALQALVDRMGANGAVFQQALSKLIEIQNMVKVEGGQNFTAASLASLNAGFSILQYIESELTSLAASVFDTSQKTQTNLTDAQFNSGALIQSYQSYLTGMYDQVVTGMKASLAAEGSAVSEGEKMWNDFASQIESNNSQFLTSTSGALNNVALINTTLSNSYDTVTRLMGDTSTVISNQMSGLMQAISGTNASLIPSDLGVSISESSPSISQLLTDFQADLDESDSKNSKLVSEISSKTQQQIALLLSKYSEVFNQASQLDEKSGFVIPAFENASIAGEIKLNSSLSALDASGLGIPDIQTQVSTSLAVVPSSVADIADLNRRITERNGTLESAARSLERLGISLTQQRSDFGASSEKTQDSMLAILQTSQSANRILSDEIATLISAVFNANTSVVDSVDKLIKSITARVIEDVGESSNDYKKHVDDWLQSVTAAEDKMKVSTSLESRTAAIDTDLKSVVGLHSSRVGQLDSDLAQSAQLASSKIEPAINSLMATADALRTKLNGKEKDATMANLENVLSSVARSVSTSTGTASDTLSKLTSDTSGSIMTNLENGANAFLGTSQQSKQALADAQASIAAGKKSVESISDLVAASAKERSESALTVINSMKANQAKIDQTIKSALEAASDDSSVSATDSATNDFPSFVVTVGDRLAAFKTLMDSSKAQVTKSGAEFDTGIAGNQVELRDAVLSAGSSIEDAIGRVGTVVDTAEGHQSDLDEFLIRLSESENAVNSKLAYPPLNDIDIGLSGVQERRLSDGDVGSRLQTETNAFTDLQTNVDQMIARASSSTGFFTR